MTIERDYRTDDDYRADPVDQGYPVEHGDGTGTDQGTDREFRQGGGYGDGSDVQGTASQDELGVIDVPGSAERTPTGDDQLNDDNLNDDQLGDDQVVDAEVAGGTTSDQVGEQHAVPAFDTDSPSGAAGAHAADPDWQTLQGRFVDDPSAAVREAADLVEDGVRRLLDSLREELTGQDDAAGTEQKRVAFQRYRAVYTALQNV